ncbi:sugar-phosphatase [Paenibacillus sp. J31TS4]|uniref:HAD family hydrolase n=1 Tax=Paenibacillus sp. J31TS4 TaxID=2807195 RepID=UPI001B1B9103|nr:HAD family hydrolase [Paenibacillus sp. J31TS4]GIP41389.1 sugar-phosphatase [Paenibacillus sp. J31TS4]
MTPIRLIVSDLDGTLLSPLHELTDSVQAAVRRFVQEGGMFTIATGRVRATVTTVVEQLDLVHPFILCNGSVLSDRAGVLETNSFAVEELIPLFREADREGIAVLLFGEEGIRSYRRLAQIEQFEIKENIRCGELDAWSLHWHKDEVQKILLIGEMERIRRVWESQLLGFANRYAVLQSEDDYLEVLPENQSKGAALERLMELLQVRPEEVMAIGNQLNDLDMIQRAGIGVAVANSHPGLIEHADYVTQASYGDGVVEAIRRFCFGESGLVEEQAQEEEAG